jgi:outer membrane immunogenic protein
MNASLKIVFLSALIAFVSGRAEAQAPTASGPASNWTGFYVGGHGGWESVQSKGIDTELLEDSTSVSDDASVVGGQIGYNRQFGAIVLGLELSGSWNSAGGNSDCFTNHPDSTVTINNLGGHQVFTSVFQCKDQLDWTMQGLARAGYAIDDGRLLPYILGGVAVSRFDVDFKVDETSELPALTAASRFRYGTGEQNYVGVVLGGGVQYALLDNISVGLEYLHAGYGSKNYRSTGHESFDISGVFDSSSNFPAAGRQDLRTDTVRAVLNYNFVEP